MIILITQKVNTNLIENFEEIIEKYENMVNLPYIECPCCNSSELVKWGSYNRKAKYIDKYVKKEIITIRRVRCKKCGKTHALLPTFIIPYKINLLDIIINSLNDEEITLNISLDTINKWRKEFNTFLPYLRTMFKILSKTKILSIIKNKLFECYEEFYIQFKKILLMTHKGIYNMAYF